MFKGFVNAVSNIASNVAQSINNASFSVSAHMINRGEIQPVTVGQILGTPGQNALEAIRINSFLVIRYRVFQYNVGESQQYSTGSWAGVIGRGCPLEAFMIENDQAGISGIKYRAYVENIGWMEWTAPGYWAGTKGRGLRIQALEFQGALNTQQQQPQYHGQQAQMQTQYPSLPVLPNYADNVQGMPVPGQYPYPMPGQGMPGQMPGQGMPSMPGQGMPGQMPGQGMPSMPGQGMPGQMPGQGMPGQW